MGFVILTASARTPNDACGVWRRSVGPADLGRGLPHGSPAPPREVELLGTSAVKAPRHPTAGPAGDRPLSPRHPREEVAAGREVDSIERNGAPGPRPAGRHDGPLLG